VDFCLGYYNNRGIKDVKISKLPPRIYMSRLLCNRGIKAELESQNCTSACL